MRFQDKLNKEERGHLREFAGRTLEGFKRNRAAQIEEVARERAAGMTWLEPCWLCSKIARKLGLEGGMKDA